MMDTDVVLVHAFSDAISARDLARLEALMHPERRFVDADALPGESCEEVARRIQDDLAGPGHGRLTATLDPTTTTSGEPALSASTRPVTRLVAALPPIVDAVGRKLEVWMDGGIRSGQDVLKAWALGARGTLIGRAMVYGLGALGEAGVARALQIIHHELDVTMAFCGHTDIRNVDRSILLPGTYP